MALRVKSINANITRGVRADAVVVPITSRGPWNEPIHQNVNEVSLTYFMTLDLFTAKRGRQLLDGEFVISHGDIRQNRTGSFSDVIFVVDDGVLPLGDLMRRLLLLSYAMRYEAVALPPLWLSPSRSSDLALHQYNTSRIVEELIAFKHKFLDSPTLIYFVFRDTPEAKNLLETTIEASSWK